MAEYTFKNIVAKSKECKKNVESNYKLGITSKWSYYFAKAIINPRSNVKKITFKTASNPSGDTFNVKVTKKDYTDICKRLISYVEKNKQLPNYITYNNKHIRVRDYMYMLARILVYYENKNIYPSYAKLNTDSFKKNTDKKSTNCSNPYKALPYNSSSGCDAMGQNTGYYCACSMLQKMFYRLGYKVSQSEIAKVAGTTTAGTSHYGIESAIAYVGRKYGVKFNVTWKNLSDIGFKGMGELMCKKNTAVGNHLLYRNQYGHYEYPLTVNTTDKIIKVINSLGDKCTSSCYCGYIETRSWSTHQSYISGISQKSILIIEKV